MIRSNSRRLYPSKINIKNEKISTSITTGDMFKQYQLCLEKYMILSEGIKTRCPQTNNFGENIGDI